MATIAAVLVAAVLVAAVPVAAVPVAAVLVAAARGRMRSYESRLFHVDAQAALGPPIGDGGQKAVAEKDPEAMIAMLDQAQNPGPAGAEHELGIVDEDGQNTKKRTRTKPWTVD
jgi:hypothetical protein